MIYRGCFLAAKKVALALHSLIKSQFPRDNLYLVTFSLYARQIQPQQLTALRWSEWEYGTNLQDGLMHARKLLARHKGGTRQIVVITDGEPTAYWEPGHSTPVFSYPPTPRTLQQTLLEVGRCTREGLRINTFMLERSYGLDAVRRRHHPHQPRARVLRRSRAAGRLHPRGLPAAEVEAHSKLVSPEGSQRVLFWRVGPLERSRVRPGTPLEERFSVVCPDNAHRDAQDVLQAPDQRR